MKVSPVEPSAERPTLTQMAAAVRLAREGVHARRVAPVIQAELFCAHEALRKAMQAYADELTARRLPIPHRLRDELRLQRRLDRLPTRMPRP